MGMPPSAWARLRASALLFCACSTARRPCSHRDRISSHWLCADCNVDAYVEYAVEALENASCASSQPFSWSLYFSWKRFAARPVHPSAFNVERLECISANSFARSIMTAARVEMPPGSPPIVKTGAPCATTPMSATFPIRRREPAPALRPPSPLSPCVPSLAPCISRTLRVHHPRPPWQL